MRKAVMLFAVMSVMIVAGCGGSGGHHSSPGVASPPSGSLDTTFGTGGIATTPVGSSQDYVQALAIQADGKIVLGGHSFLDSNTFALARYNTDGSPDTTFGTDGIVTTTFGAGESLIYELAIQADGKIVAGGQSWNGSSGFSFALARYNTDGSLDAAFGTGGIVITSVTVNDYVRALAIQPDGKIVAGGNAWSPRTPGLVSPWPGTTPTGAWIRRSVRTA